MTTDDLSFALLLLKTISSEYANYGSLLGLALWQLPRCEHLSKELETCPNRHRYYRDALFRAIADAVWLKRQPSCLLLALAGADIDADDEHVR